MTPQLRGAQVFTNKSTEGALPETHVFRPWK